MSMSPKSDDYHLLGTSFTYTNFTVLLSTTCSMCQSYLGIPSTNEKPDLGNTLSISKNAVILVAARR
jgi:hypothetical protein